MVCEGTTPLIGSDVVRISQTLELDPIHFVAAEPSADGALIAGRPMRIVMRQAQGRCVFALAQKSGAVICGLGALGPCAARSHDPLWPERIAAWNRLVVDRPKPLEVFLDHLLAAE